MLSAMIKRAALVSVVAAGAILVGCQHSPAKSAQSANKVAPTAQMASCPKCKTVWETKPASSSNSTPIRTQVMQCDDCTNAVTNFARTGEFKHVCATCGDKVDEMCLKH